MEYISYICFVLGSWEYNIFISKTNSKQFFAYRNTNLMILFLNYCFRIKTNKYYII